MSDVGAYASGTPSIASQDRFTVFQRGVKVAEADGIRLDDHHLYIDQLVATKGFLLDWPFQFRGKNYQTNGSSIPRRHGKGTVYSGLTARDLSLL